MKEENEACLNGVLPDTCISTCITRCEKGIYSNSFLSQPSQERIECWGGIGFGSKDETKGRTVKECISS